MSATGDRGRAGPGDRDIRVPDGARRQTVPNENEGHGTRIGAHDIKSAISMRGVTWFHVRVTRRRSASRQAADVPPPPGAGAPPWWDLTR